MEKPIAQNHRIISAAFDVEGVVAIDFMSSIHVPIVAVVSSGVDSVVNAACE